MSKWGLTHKTYEFLEPEEWNTVVDALNELDKRCPLEFNGGVYGFTGDGATRVFSIPHGLSATPTVALVGKGSADLPDIDFWTADDQYIIVTFKTAPETGLAGKLWWLALRW
ncbi:MAG: hypothetical protein ACTSVD_07040 [Candidatus Thorarchaeota archaeon]